MSHLKFWARVALYSPTWILMSVLSLVLTVIGFFVVPLALALARQRITPYSGGEYIWVPPRWLWLWGNDQEGYDPRWYQIYRPTWHPWLRRYEWAAWRNPVNNLRFVKWLRPTPGKARLHWGGSAMFLTRGIFSRLIVTLDNGDLLIGWKIDPMAAHWDPTTAMPRLWEVLPWGYGVRYRSHETRDGVWDAQERARDESYGDY